MWIVLTLLLGCPGGADDRVEWELDLSDADADGSKSQEDCDDRDPTHAPGADELCDGADNDCDGLVDEGSACHELECEDGVDDDRDGLVDCEDADCAWVLACVESCGDGVEDDGDGLVVCEDDDCWTPDCHPGGVRARVTGGSLDLWGRFKEDLFSGCGFSGKSWLVGTSMHARSVRGTVQVLPSAGATWDQAVACEWSALGGDQARLNRWNSTTFRDAS